LEIWTSDKGMSYTVNDGEVRCWEDDFYTWLANHLGVSEEEAMDADCDDPQFRKPFFTDFCTRNKITHVRDLDNSPDEITLKEFLARLD